MPQASRSASRTASRIVRSKRESMAAAPSLDALRAVRGHHRALAADVASQVLGNADVELRRRLRQQGPINIFVGYPHNLARFVVERAQYVRHVDHLPALVEQLAGQRGVGRGIQL